MSFPSYTFYRPLLFYGENDAFVLRFFELQAKKASSDDYEPVNGAPASPEEYFPKHLVFSDTALTKRNEEKGFCRAERRCRTCFKFMRSTRATRSPFKKNVKVCTKKPKYKVARK